MSANWNKVMHSDYNEVLRHGLSCKNLMVCKREECSLKCPDYESNQVKKVTV